MSHPLQYTKANEITNSALFTCICALEDMCSTALARVSLLTFELSGYIGYKAARHLSRKATKAIYVMKRLVQTGPQVLVITLWWDGEWKVCLFWSSRDCGVRVSGLCHWS